MIRIMIWIIIRIMIWMMIYVWELQEKARRSADLSQNLDATRARLQGQLRRKEAKNNRLIVQIKVRGHSRMKVRGHSSTGGLESSP